MQFRQTRQWWNLEMISAHLPELRATNMDAKIGGITSGSFDC
jgi:hypothetical protein